MNRSRAMSFKLLIASAVVVAFAVFAPMASAAISPEVSTVYDSDVPGAHSDYTVIQEFRYDSNGVEPTATTAAGQDLKKWILDGPAGLVGNPNAIPYADRCDPASFDPTGGSPYNTFFIGSCPASSKVGEASVYLVNDAQSGACPAAPIQCLTAGFDMALLGTPLEGDIYLLQSSPEVPTTLGTLFSSVSYQPFNFGGSGVCASPPCPIQPKTKSVLAPVTNLSSNNNGDTDFRIRTIPAEYSNPPSTLLPTAYGHAGLLSGGTPLHVRRIDQRLYGTVGGQPFLTMPARCDSWDTYGYAIAWNEGAAPSGSLTMDPNHTGDNTYVKSAVDSVTPDCTTKPPLKAAASGVLTGSTARESYPGLEVTVTDPTAVDDDQPSKLVSTLPASVTINVAALSNLCSDAQRDSDTCPAASQVGTAAIETPLIGAGLTGRVYATSGSTPGLPYLSIFVDGAVKFRLDATTKFVGPNFNQIETTFDNLPQSPFTSFNVTIDGGSSSSSLLLARRCPTDGSAPADDPITFAMNGYAGGSIDSSSPTTLDPCYGASNPSKVSKCVKISKQLKVSPKGLIAIPTIREVQLLTGSKSSSLNRRARDGGSPFAFKYTLKKADYKKNKTYYYGYKVTYKDGKVIKTKAASFKTCK